MSYRWWSSCRSNVGRIRQINEDAVLDMANIGLWLVADGMGGHSRGDLASKIIIESFEGLKSPASLSEFAMEVRTRLKSAHRAVKGESSRAGGRQIMGSTVVALLVFKGRWLCMWVGDSRAYLLRDHRLIQITKDHSIAQELVDLGKLGKNEMDTHPYANHITRAIGANPELVLDERSSKLHDGDVFLLCSDGLTKELSETEISNVIQSYDTDLATQELIDLSLEHGGRDNVTVALVSFEETTGFSEPVSDDTAINYEIVRNNLGAIDRGALHLKKRTAHSVDEIYTRSE
ncbi:MAG: protein phosphatase 2C domain-containing protein [Candidatus Thiodiazotropha sp.]